MPPYIGRVEATIKNIRHPQDSQYSYAVSEPTRELVHHIIFNKTDGKQISIGDRVLALFNSPYPNSVSIHETPNLHIYVLYPAYHVEKIQ